MLRTAGPLLALTACWRDAAPPPPLRGDTRAPEAPPPERISWHGTCGDPSYGWREAIAVTLTIRDDGRELVATGTLAFADRRARAKLRGPHLREARHTLRGAMREIEGMGTSWGLILEVEPGSAAIRGRFLEVLDSGGEEEMCRSRGRAEATRVRQFVCAPSTSVSPASARRRIRFTSSPAHACVGAR